MSRLPPLPHWCESGSPFAEQMQAYATAATEPLLQRIAELEQELSKVNNEFGSETAFWPNAYQRVAALKELSHQRWRENEVLKRQLEEARKDAERYRWWRDNACGNPAMVATLLAPTYFTEQIDAAIDAAMQKGQS